MIRIKAWRVGALTLTLAVFACAKHRGAVEADVPPPDRVARLTAIGDSIFHQRACARCHGPTAAGTRNAPSLLGPRFLHVNGGFRDFVRIITTGVPLDSIKDKSHTLDMQPRGGRQNPLNDDQILAVAAYVYSLSHRKP